MNNFEELGRTKAGDDDGRRSNTSDFVLEEEVERLEKTNCGETRSTRRKMEK